MPSALENRVMRKVAFRIVPFIMLLYFIAYQSLHKFTHKHSSNDLQGGAA
jgi:hypothetical protein